jgi:hypothetical protein
MASAHGTITDDAPATASPWRAPLYRLRGEPLPIFLFADATLPAASLWAGARLARHDLDPAPLAVFAEAPSPRLLQRLVAALFAGKRVLLRDPEAPISAVPEIDGAPGDVFASGLDGRAVRLPLEDVFAGCTECPPASLQLPARDWHRSEVLARVLRALITPTHVLLDL